MVFVQYFELSTGYDWKSQTVKSELIKPIEACGDRAVVILDGRQSLATWHNDARESNGYRRPVYCGYQTYKGRALQGQNLFVIM